MGEAGFWFDARVWGGAVFKYFTTHSNGNPCVYDQSYQAGDTWVQISDTKPREILYMAFSAPNITLPIITHMPSDGDQYREYDDQMPSIYTPNQDSKGVAICVHLLLLNIAGVSRFCIKN
ncbi:hypothetical protein TWF106_007640 [Orbilia oligospora]|uniref:Uncharacterized protein n=1 Tax=Orbilia oligospora TaxID=2813651 RepID=A0A7C8ULJ9_ORBOL|nr:hypothetical protein TWF106_007640 [Orbilia oligospora]